MAVPFLFPVCTLLLASQVFERALCSFTQLGSLFECFFTGVSRLVKLDEVPHNVPLVSLCLSQVALLDLIVLVV